MSNYHLDVKLTIWERYEFESKEQMLEAKAKLESGELKTTLDVSDTYDLQSELLVDTTEELEVYDNNDQPTMELFNDGKVVWNNFSTTNTEIVGEFVNDGDYQLLDYVFSPFNTEDGFTNIEVRDFDDVLVGEIAGLEIPDEDDEEAIIQFEEILILWLKGESLN